jgi:Protein NO VEIN, C-terminal
VRTAPRIVARPYLAADNGLSRTGPSEGGAGALHFEYSLAIREERVMQLGTASALKKFDREYDSLYEDEAGQSRGAFIRAFPLKRIGELTLDDYVIGKGTPSFCTHVEVKTKRWANIFGATAFKFGVYYGRTASDARKMYRWGRKFGPNVNDAFSNVKDALLELVKAGRRLRFYDIDGNSLSQMFKAKILSLYFPDKYLNVCSKDVIETLAAEIGIAENVAVSEQQHLLFEAKRRDPIARDWSNPKAMTFLYNTYLRTEDERENLTKARKKVHRKLNVDDMLENRKRIGEMSERYALRWEKERLVGLGMRPRIKDCRETPSCGYDFETLSGEGRCIEVKSAGKLHFDGGFRFFLSDTQHKVSRLRENRERYYFYLVYYDDDGKPQELEPWKASELYAISELGPNGYVVSFEREESD